MIQAGLRAAIHSSLKTNHDADSLNSSIPQPESLCHCYGQRDIGLNDKINSHQILINRTYSGCQVFEM
jgi:hypothetical protein